VEGGLPSLGLSTGPAVSDAGGVDGWSATGAFNFKRDNSLGATVERLAPFIVIGVLVWAVMKR